MDKSHIIAALAVFTIGSTLAAAIFHFGFHLKDPKNLEAAKRVAADHESATSKVTSAGVQGRTLRQRLDDTPGVNARLGREGNLTPLDALTIRWSEVRDTLDKTPVTREL